MDKSEYKIHIIGAGVSGLVAAQVLESNGYSPVIFEKTNRAGGRVKTDIVDGYQLDHGFQVLLSAYPMAQKYLNFEELNLQEFLPGAVIFKNGKQQTIGDPLRDVSLLWPTLFSGIGSFSDKLKIFRLNTELNKKSISDIFKEKETSTLDYLKKKGFSDNIINDFFKPFFSGIFLESDLKTSSRMFQFVYKMFGVGLAVLPKSGIEAIPRQLEKKLKSTQIHYNTEVISIDNHEIKLKNGSTLKSDYILLATEKDNLVSNEKTGTISWKKCDTLYFTVAQRNIKKPLIGLVADQDALVNNIFFHTSLENVHRGEAELLSVTVVKPHSYSSEELIVKVQGELHTYCNISDTVFLKHYYIPNALPDLKNISYTLTPEESQLSPTLFQAGDRLLNSSLNAAMQSGEVAAQAIIARIENK